MSLCWLNRAKVIYTQFLLTKPVTYFPFNANHLELNSRRHFTSIASGELHAMKQSAILCKVCMRSTSHWFRLVGDCNEDLLSPLIRCMDNNVLWRNDHFVNSNML